MMKIPAIISCNANTCCISDLKKNIEVWYVNLQEKRSLYTLCRSLLSVDEQQRSSRFKFKQHAQDYSLGRGLLRVLLGCYLQQAPESLRFSYSCYGKPQLSESQFLQFNLSHSNYALAYCFTLQAKVGIDIEYVDKKRSLDPLITRCFSCSDQHYLNKLSEEEKVRNFFQGWVRKEAILKALGKGLNYPLADLSVYFNGESTHTVCDDGEKNSWVLHSLPDPLAEFVAAVAVNTIDKKIKLKGWI